MDKKVTQMDPADSILYFLGGIVLYTCIIFLLAIPAQWLWNKSVVHMFTLSEIAYMDMVRFLILIRILLPGSSGMPSGGPDA